MNNMGKGTASGIKSVSTTEAKNLVSQGDYMLLDVRTKGEFAEYHAPEAINIPLNEIVDRVAEIPREKNILVVCHSGVRSRHAVDALQKLGYEHVINVSGGMQAWSK